MRKRNLFWGVFLLLAGVLVVAGQLTGFVQLGFWSILCGIGLVAVLVQSLYSRNIVVAMLAVAALYIVFQTPLHFFYISPWLLLLAALLVGIGLTVIIRPRRRQWHSEWKRVEPGQAMSEEQGGDDNHPEVSVSFGGSSRYLHATALERVLLRASFGSLEVYFEQATLAPGGADVIVDCSFGAIKLFVPREWRVTDDVAASIGAMQHDAHRAHPEAGAPHLRVTGNVSFGGVEIEYV